ncbi:MAG: cofactor-independent phosphoglycerate mutase [Planctomycetes bacterium]|nr:cofactor-independent phosphoglycerate mutase [Planctomycetota bacterium]
MKFVVLCPDGAADWPVPGLDNKTPLEAAELPNLARMAREGTVGRTQHAVEAVGNGSDVCCMSLLGFDPARYHTGRAPLEAKSLGLDLASDEIAVRCNTVTVEDGLMVDYSAGHISTNESRQLIEAVQASLGAEGLRFYPGVQYRHILVVRKPEGARMDAKCTAPHDITGKSVQPHLPQGADAPLLLDLMERSKAVLANHPVNAERVKRHLNPATQIWLWGHGPRPALPGFRETFGVGGAMISAVDLLKSLALYLGLEVLDVPGITGFTDTDYAAKGRAAVEALARHDLVFVHVEAPDECGHLGDAKQKTEALRRIDADVLAPILNSEYVQRNELRVLVCPDHPTPCALKTHATEPVPFVAWGPEVPMRGGVYTEAGSKRAGLVVEHGYDLMGRFLRNEW